MMNRREEKFTLFLGEAVKVIESQAVILSKNYNNGNAIYTAKQMAVKCGFTNIDETMIATAASELTTNIIRYAENGKLTISIIKNIQDGRIGIEIFASDNGPGIPDINLAMQEQYTTFPNSLGLGLPSVKRIMDEFYIESFVGEGTRVLARKWEK